LQGYGLIVQTVSLVRRRSVSGPELLGIGFGLASAASWGAGDFSGGVATRRSNVYGVVIVSQAVGLVLLLALALLLAEPLPAANDLLWGAAGGMAGGIGAVALYRGLAVGRMGVVAPVAAVVSAGVPVAFGLFLEGLPAAPQLLGFALAFVAVWFVSRSGEGAQILLRELALPLAAGVGFGVFFIAIDHVSERAILWPLVGARIASLTMLLAVAALLRQRATPARGHLPLIALVGLFDAGGNAFYALAAQAGRLDVAAVLGSLYPAATVLLARFVLKERIARQQWLGVAAALAAVVLIAW
jgi:drug/metabolite transporter (DMT)-like permease